MDDHPSMPSVLPSTRAFTPTASLRHRQFHLIVAGTGRRRRCIVGRSLDFGLKFRSRGKAIIMNQFGYPGTPSSLALKILQGIFSFTAFSILMVTTRLAALKAYGYLILGTLIEAMWSLALSCFYLVLMIKDAGLSPAILNVIVVCELIAANVQSSAAISAIGPTFHFLIDTPRCSYRSKECALILLSIGVALFAWLCAMTSFVFVLWHRLSLSGHQ